MNKLAICIPTFKRPAFLRRLIRDVLNQTLQPDVFIVVDGDPSSSEVRRMLLNLKFPHECLVVYVPSNYGNLPYQRYLGWRVARECNCQNLLYLDDDLLIPQRDAVEKTTAPLLLITHNIVGVTARIVMGESATASASVLVHPGWDRPRTQVLVQRFGGAKKISPGGLSPSGHRVLPIDRGNDYEPVSWLRGGVMAYRMDSLTQQCFSEDLFSMYHKGYGRAEDTLLSRRVGGNMVSAFCATFEHPGDDSPKAYPTRGFRLGFAAAYSRRLLNDNYRGLTPPGFSERWGLVKSYIGSTLLIWWQAILDPRRQKLAQASGYTLGALRGLLKKPAAKTLTPQINWWREAEAALRHLIIIKEADCE
jgi:glycosyltransferase involved in cell wall biosynthesis